MKTKSTESLTLRLPAKLKRDIEKAAADARRTASDWVRLVVEDHLKQQQRVKK